MNPPTLNGPDQADPERVGLQARVVRRADSNESSYRADANDLFDAYGRHPAYDEMFRSRGGVGPHCAALFDELRRRVGRISSASSSSKRTRPFSTQGITFTFTATSRAPSGFFPSISSRASSRRREWQTLEQRPDAAAHGDQPVLEGRLHEGRILAEGVVPARAGHSCRHFRREMRGVRCTRHLRVGRRHRPGPREDGRFVVLEDNLRVPSGVSYMLANREVTKRCLPGLFDRYHVGRSRTTARRCWRRCARWRRRRAEPTIVVLTPGVGNSAYFEHAFLAREMGVALVEGRDLLVHDNVVYMRTTAGSRRVDVIYRRVDDDFLDPLAFRPTRTSASPAAQRLSRRQRVARQRRSAPARRRQGVYAYVPAIIRSTCARSRSSRTSRPICSQPSDQQ
jgi:uncharacterized circularly permuted ATP-grasp superfamily protein